MFTLIVEHATYDGSGGNVVTIGKLRLVDLAGSEKYVFYIAKTAKNFRLVRPPLVTSGLEGLPHFRGWICTVRWTPSNPATLAECPDLRGGFAT